MARPFRLEFAGVLYHLTSRGYRREAIYRGADDREAWLGYTMAEIGDHFGVYYMTVSRVVREFEGA